MWYVVLIIQETHMALCCVNTYPDIEFPIIKIRRSNAYTNKMASLYRDSSLVHSCHSWFCVGFSSCEDLYGRENGKTPMSVVFPPENKLQGVRFWDTVSSFYCRMGDLKASVSLGKKMKNTFTQFSLSVLSDDGSYLCSWWSRHYYK